MKRWVLLTTFCLCLIMLSGCSSLVLSLILSTNTQTSVTDNTHTWSRLYDNSNEKARSLFSELLDALSSNDSASVCKLYSPTTVAIVADLDSSVNKLCNQYAGDFVSYEMIGPDVSSSKNNGEKKEIISASFTVTTTTDLYYFVIQFCTTDTASPNNVGLHSVYFSKFGTGDDFTFWGDQKWTPGVVFWDEINPPQGTGTRKTGDGSLS